MISRNSDLENIQILKVNIRTCSSPGPLPCADLYPSEQPLTGTLEPEPLVSARQGTLIGAQEVDCASI